MKYCGRIMVCVLVGVGLNAAAIVSVSDAKGGPYRAIGRRNVFGLLPPLSSRTEAPTSIVIRPKISLAGITTLLGYKAAFLMLPAKPDGVRECLMLREGEAQGEIHVREIHQKTVSVINHGEEELLDFDEVPPPNFIVGDSGPTLPAISQQPPPTPEQQMLVIEAQRMKALQDGDPIAKILPPTEFTPEITGATP